MTIKALVFDFDGLILDTETPEYLAWQAVYRWYGTNLELTEWLACVGSSQDKFDPFLTLQERAATPVDDLDVRKLHRRTFLQHMQNQKPLPGVLETIHAARQAGLKIGIASSSDRAWVRSFLGRNGLPAEFDCLCTAEDVQHVKPDPALFLCAAGRLGVQPYETLAFEDSLNGLKSAKRAGMYCVAVPNFVTRQLDFSEADRILTSLAEVPLDELINQINV